MDQATFDRILKEEGIDDARMRQNIWLDRPSDDIGEKQLRHAAQQFKNSLPGLKVRRALNDAMAREYGWNK